MSEGFKINHRCSNPNCGTSRCALQCWWGNQNELNQWSNCHSPRKKSINSSQEKHYLHVWGCMLWHAHVSWLYLYIFARFCWLNCHGWWHAKPILVLIEPLVAGLYHPQLLLSEAPSRNWSGKLQKLTKLTLRHFGIVTLRLIISLIIWIFWMW